MFLPHPNPNKNIAHLGPHLSDLPGVVQLYPNCLNPHISSITTECCQTIFNPIFDNAFFTKYSSLNIEHFNANVQKQALRQLIVGIKIFFETIYSDPEYENVIVFIMNAFLKNVYPPDNFLFQYESSRLSLNRFGLISANQEFVEKMVDDFDPEQQRSILQSYSIDQERGASFGARHGLDPAKKRFGSQFNARGSRLSKANRKSQPKDIFQLARAQNQPNSRKSLFSKQATKQRASLANRDSINNKLSHQSSPAYPRSNTIKSSISQLEDSAYHPSNQTGNDQESYTFESDSEEFNIHGSEMTMSIPPTKMLTTNLQKTRNSELKTLHQHASLPYRLKPKSSVSVPPPARGVDQHVTSVMLIHFYLIIKVFIGIYINIFYSHNNCVKVVGSLLYHYSLKIFNGMGLERHLPDRSLEIAPGEQRVIRPVSLDSSPYWHHPSAGYTHDYMDGEKPPIKDMLYTPNIKEAFEENVFCAEIMSVVGHLNRMILKLTFRFRSKIKMKALDDGVKLVKKHQKALGPAATLRFIQGLQRKIRLLKKE